MKLAKRYFQFCTILKILFWQILFNIGLQTAKLFRFLLLICFPVLYKQFSTKTKVFNRELSFFRYFTSNDKTSWRQQATAKINDFSKIRLLFEKIRMEPQHTNVLRTHSPYMRPRATVVAQDTILKTNSERSWKVKLWEKGFLRPG